MDVPLNLRGKVMTRQRLLTERAAARAEGRTVVQCHGCFDIVHPGHVRHLQHAARQGDILLVSITADELMNKGDGRPLFPQELRAENLAALDCVDWVFINHDETAIGLLAEVQPDIYIKGREYESNDDPRFALERDAVERAGGRIVFSSGDIVFSSTALIASLERRQDPFHARLHQLVSSGELAPDGIGPLVDSFAGQRVMVVGESIRDTYILCDQPDVAGEGPVLSLRPLDRMCYDGGAAIVARQLAAMGARPTLVTALPADAGEMRDRLQAEGVELRSIEHDGEMMEKQRFLVGSQKVMKVDMSRPLALDAARQNELITIAQRAAEEHDAAIIADFGQGLLTPKVLTEVVDVVRPRVRFLSGDVSGARNALMKMRDMDLTCPTEQELRAAAADFEDSLNAVVWRYLQKTETQRVFVTMGGDGMIAFDRLPHADDDTNAWPSRVRGEHVPALAPHAVDTLGCGDALLAAATLALHCGGSVADAAFLGSIAAATQATRLGNEVITAADLRSGAQRVLGARIAIAPSRIGARLAV
ncbi:MAG: PfkB family carbohydrate kinase [Planctomycetota bacterium]